MFGRYLLLCSIALLFARNTLATSSLPCKTPEECKSVMAHQFQIEYITNLISFLKQKLFVMENAANDFIKADPSNETKIKEIIKTITDQRELLENSRYLSKEKLLEVTSKIDDIKNELQVLNSNKVNIQPHVDRVRGAKRTVMKSVLDYWTEASIVARSIDTSQLPDYDAINADVNKVIGMQITKDNELEIFKLVERILIFFEVDESLIKN